MDLTAETITARPEEYVDYLSLILRIQILKSGRARAIRESDIVQDTLARAWDKRAQFKGSTVGEFKKWLSTILVHELYDAMTKEGKRPEIPVSVLLKDVADSSRRAEIFVASQSRPSQAATRDEEIERAVRLLASLPDDQRTAIHLKHCEDWSVAQIAQKMDRSVAAVAGLLRRGLKVLREQLCEE